MAMELEIKLSAPAHEPVRDALRSAGAEPVSRVLELNTILDQPDGRLRNKGEALRVRAFKILDGPPRPARLTHKAPGPLSKFKSRQEREVEVGDAEAALDILHALGFVDCLSFEKLRETWQMDGCLVELDELPILGRFVEIEGPSEAAIDAVRNKLGLSNLNHIKPSYVAMLIRHLEQNGSADRDVRFPV